MGPVLHYDEAAGVLELLLELDVSVEVLELEVLELEVLEPDEDVESDFDAVESVFVAGTESDALPRESVR